MNRRSYGYGGSVFAASTRGVSYGMGHKEHWRTFFMVVYQRISGNALVTDKMGKLRLCDAAHLTLRLRCQGMHRLGDGGMVVAETHTSGLHRIFPIFLAFLLAKA
jgi:hypothetical protein